MVPHKGRVLLLEDDVSFSEIIRGFLTENGYTVVLVPNGGEGIREVLAGDFALVLCDLLMPTLPGDMFYRAVERIRPRLCERFVFMTGYANDPKTSEFIRSINGYVLRKPFHMRDLLASLDYAELRGTFQSVFESASAGPVVSHVRPLAFPVPAEEDFHPPAPAVAPADPVPGVPECAPASGEVRGGGGVGSRLLAAAGFAAIVLAGAMLGFRHVNAQRRAAAAVAELRALEAEWRVTSAHLEHAELARGGFASLPKRAKRIAEERAAGGWTGALRAVATVGGPDVEVRGIAARGIEGPAGACELRVDGVAAGGAPRLIADRFCHALRREMERRLPGMVATELEKLEDEPEPAVPSDLHRASFAITLKIRPVVK